jgi:hypothetical protein
VKEPLFGVRGLIDAAGSTWSSFESRRQGGEERAQEFDGRSIASDHETKTAIEAEVTAARANVDVVDPSGAEALRAGDIIAVIAVASVDDDVAFARERR